MFIEILLTFHKSRKCFVRYDIQVFTRVMSYRLSCLGYLYHVDSVASSPGSGTGHPAGGNSSTDPTRGGATAIQARQPGVAPLHPGLAERGLRCAPGG